MKTALITGATSGIGMASAKKFADEGINLIICGRRENRLAELKNSLTQKVAVHTLPFDVRNQSDVEHAIKSIPSEFSSIDILLNNAGNAHGRDLFHESALEDMDAMIDINVKGLLYVSKAVVSGMVERGSGHVVNVGSIAGKEVYANGTVYCASKFAVDAITEGLRKDLFSTNVKVSQICPGLVETEFSKVRFKGDMDKSDKVYRGFDALQAEDIAEIIFFMVSRPAHVNIADCLVLPTDQVSGTSVYRRETE